MFRNIKYDPRDPPHEALKEFVCNVYEFLEDLVNAKEPDWPVEFYPELVGPMRDAWPEMRRARRNLLIAIRRLENEEIVRHGLGGAQLAFKLAVINRFSLPLPNLPLLPGLKKLLQAIDVLLESLIAGTHAGTALAEMKDYIGISVQDG